jgi:hypothetical protein
MGTSWDVASADGGRGLPTWTAESSNFVWFDAGAWGTTIFRKQVGHSICPPLVLESAVICWPQTGHANLNSLIASTATIPQAAGNDNAFFGSDFHGGASHIQCERSE